MASRTPQWASEITGLSIEEIEGFAALIGRTKRTFFRLGYGFSRQRNGAVAMHAALSVPTVYGHWQVEGGGAFHNNGALWRFDKALIEGLGDLDPTIRHLDQSRIGAVLTGDPKALAGGPPVTAMLVQNTNPANVAPEQRDVVRGLLREDLFVAVHEQFMTDTARLADLVLPAATSVEYDDIYRGGGQSHILFGPKLIQHPDTVRTNHFVIEELAKRLGVADRPGFGMTERGLIDDLLRRSGYEGLDALERDRWLDVQPGFDEAHYIGGFATPGGKFRFRVDWAGLAAPNRPPESMGLLGPVDALPSLPDHAPLIENADAEHPFRLATPPARQFLNSSFAETEGSRKREGRPELRMHPDDAVRLGLEDGQRVEVGNARGELVLPLKLDAATKPGVLIHEGLWPNGAFERGEGINVLTGADPAAPFGGAAFHDNKVWVRPA